MENLDAPGVRGEVGERQLSGRGHDLLDTDSFFLLMQRTGECRF